jgi:uncharacterized protein
MIDNINQPWHPDEEHKHDAHSPEDTAEGANQERHGARGTAAMDAKTRQEVARKGGLAVSRNRQHMAEIGRKGGQAVSKNREHMAKIGRKGGAASRGSGKTGGEDSGGGFGEGGNTGESQG